MRKRKAINVLSMIIDAQTKSSMKTFKETNHEGKKLVGQVAAKISEVKVGGQKKSARAARLRANRSRIWPSRQFLINLQL